MARFDIRRLPTEAGQGGGEGRDVLARAAADLQHRAVATAQEAPQDLEDRLAIAGKSGRDKLPPGGVLFLCVMRVGQDELLGKACVIAASRLIRIRPVWSCPV